MSNWKQFVSNQSLKKFLSFGVIGGGIAVGGAALLTLLIEVFKVHPQWANLIQAIVAVETNFLLNNHITWRDRRHHSSLTSRLGRYHLSKVVTVTVNQILFALLSMVGLHYLIIYVCNLGIITILNFVFNEKFVFRHHGDAEHQK